MIISVNKTATKSAVAASLIGAVCLMGGCMQSTSGDAGGQSEVYVYKGRIDPLTTQPAANRAAKLSERFKLVQARQ